MHLSLEARQFIGTAKLFTKSGFCMQCGVPTLNGASDDGDDQASDDSQRSSPADLSRSCELDE